MKRYIEFPLENGESIVIEVAEVEPEYGTIKAGRAEDVAEKAKQTFEQALDRVKPAVDAVMSRLRTLQPDEVDVEFGIKLNTKAGAFIASAGTEANFKVTLTWKREQPESP